MSQSDVYIYGMTVLSTIRFASACAAIVCTRFPSVRQPPTLDEITSLIRSRKQEDM